MKTNNLVLASSSKYRQQLLSTILPNFFVAAPNIDETCLLDELPEQTSRRLSELKVRTLQQQFPRHLIIGSDQVAVCNGIRLGKPGNRARAVQQLRCASGQTVVFFTSISVLNSATGQCITETDRCAVSFKQLSDDQIERYIDRDRPFDCAGSFKSEGLGIVLLESIRGDDPNALIGLPLIKLTGILEKFGLSVL
ncbi:MAG: Maf family protein [Gammaproteobacteria bacterium]